MGLMFCQPADTREVWHAMNTTSESNSPGAFKYELLGVLMVQLVPMMRKSRMRILANNSQQQL